MEPSENISINYKELVLETLKNNFRSVLVGTFTISLFFSLLYFQISQNPHIGTNALSLFDTSDHTSPTIKDLSQKVSKNNVAMLNKPSPSSDSLSIAADTQGQISAISTQQVTVKGERYTVQPGDSISSIALKVYGDLNAWPRIAQANKITNPENIEVGMVLTIPR